MSPEDDDGRLFRENDNLGADSSVWLRMCRQLIVSGKPIGSVTALTIDMGDSGQCCIGFCTETQKNRLVFWPVLPTNADMSCIGQEIKTFDHATLELPSEKIHVTAYDAAGKSVHLNNQWRTQHLTDASLAMWFSCLVRKDILLNQDTEIQRLVPMPLKDKERRLSEITKLLKNRMNATIRIPSVAMGDYIYYGVYLVSKMITGESFSPNILPCPSTLGSQIQDLPENFEYHLEVTAFELKTQTLVVVASQPPGKLNQDVSWGFPQRK
jgi:hypothetical protein